MKPPHLAFGLVLLVSSLASGQDADYRKERVCKTSADCVSVKLPCCSEACTSVNQASVAAAEERRRRACALKDCKRPDPKDERSCSLVPVCVERGCVLVEPPDGGQAKAPSK
jgi:hypothetical protein